MASLLERYHDKIRGVISCYDRVIIKGTLPGFCYSEGMTSYLYAKKIRIFDYSKWAEPLRDQIRANAEEIAERHGVTIEFLRKAKDFRKTVFPACPNLGAIQSDLLLQRAQLAGLSTGQEKDRKQAPGKRLHRHR